VLVAEYDDKPVAKVIDFGVAKAIGPKLTERTMFTEFGQVVGTLEYMSPEQAKFNALDIDTRSDVYALGVLVERQLQRLACVLDNLRRQPRSGLGVDVRELIVDQSLLAWPREPCEQFLAAFLHFLDWGVAQLLQLI
jgi:serine/threonine protein kinase